MPDMTMTHDLVCRTCGKHLAASTTVWYDATDTRRDTAVQAATNLQKMAADPSFLDAAPTCSNCGDRAWLLSDQSAMSTKPSFDEVEEKIA